MRAVIVLFLIGELKWQKLEAIEFYFNFTILLYFSFFFGGILSDFKLGKNAALERGLIFVTLGYIFLSLTSFLYLAIGLIIIGTGLSRPNEISLIGNLYQRSPILKDEGFSLLLIGINFGAFTSILIVSWVSNLLGYKVAFFISALTSIASLIVYRKEKSSLLYLDNNQLPVVPKIKVIIQNTSSNWIIVFFLITTLASPIYWWGYEISSPSLINFEETIFKSDFFIFRLERLYPILVLLMGIPIANYWTNRGIKNKNVNPFYKFGISAIFMCLSFMTLYFFTSVTNFNDESLGMGGFILIFVYALQVISEMSLVPAGLSFVDTLTGQKFKATAMGFLLALPIFPRLISIYFDFGYDKGEQVNSESWVIYILYYLVFAVVLLWLSNEYYDKLKKIIK